VESIDALAEAPVSRTLGQTLASERERQGMSRTDAAQRLHMSAYQIEAIETGDYTRLPKGTFLRGFVRNYAKVLGLPGDDALALLPEHAPRDQKPGIVVPTQNIRFDPIGDRLQNPYVKAATLALVALAVGFAAMYWWLFIKPTPPGAAGHRSTEKQIVVAPPAAQPETSAVAPAEPARIEAPRIELATIEPPQSGAMKLQSVKPDASPPPKPDALPPPKADAKTAAKPDAKTAAKPDVPPPQKPDVKMAARADPPPPLPLPKPEARPIAPLAVAAAPAKSEVVRVGNDGSILKFRFKGSSWVEIRDAKGRVLLQRLNPAGSEAEVSGKPPFNVIVGNAPEVQLFYNDHPFDLEPHTKVAVARFTVE
jgi:cytoskeleton protein RodZ